MSPISSARRPRGPMFVPLPPGLEEELMLLPHEHLVDTPWDLPVPVQQPYGDAAEVGADEAEHQAILAPWRSGDLGEADHQAILMPRKIGDVAMAFKLPGALGLAPALPDETKRAALLASTSAAAVTVKDPWAAEPLTAGPLAQETAAPVEPAANVSQDSEEADAVLRLCWGDASLRRQLRKGSNEQPADFGGACSRWWVRPNCALLCPLTHFPIRLLPYPPFKLRIDPNRSNPHRLVDGKYLAMYVIATNNYMACGRALQAPDLSALDSYLHRCKLGPFRPGRVMALAKQATAAATPEQRRAAAKEHRKVVVAAQIELGKLRRIQENRLAQFNKENVDAYNGSKEAALSDDSGPRSRVSSGGSRASMASAPSTASGASSAPTDWTATSSWTEWSSAEWQWAPAHQ